MNMAFVLTNELINMYTLQTSEFPCQL